MPYDFCNSSLRISSTFAIVCYLDYNLASGNCALLMLLGYKYITCYLLVIRHNKSEIFISLICSHKCLNLMVNYIYNLSFCSFIALFRKCYNYLDFIMVESIFRVACLYKYILILSFYRHKSKAPACTFKCTYKCNIIRLHILSFFTYSYCSVSHKCIQYFLQLVSLILRNTK